MAPFTLNRDSSGVAIGGLRLPVITVPVADYNGDDCVLLGTSTPLAAATLHGLYPTHADYVAKMVTATRAAVRERYMTAQDGVDLLQRACASAIPDWGVTAPGDQPSDCARLPELVSKRVRRPRGRR